MTGDATSGRLLLEREAERERLRECVRSAAAGTGRLVIVEGPAGVGKTRLLQDVAEEAHVNGLEVLSAIAGELDQGSPLGVAQQLLGPAVAGQPGGAAPERGYFSIYGLTWLVVERSQESPLLLSVDDGHWADGASLRWLAHVARLARDLPVLVVIAVRTGEPGSAPELDALAVDPIADVLQPAPLSAEAVERWVRAELGERASDTFCAACHRATGGNPMLLGELVHEFADAGADADEEAAAMVHRMAPARAARMAAARLDRFPEPARAIARAVAVLEHADLSVAAALAGLEVADACAAVDALAAADILEPVLPLRFCHPLNRAAIYSTLGPAARDESHRLAAELLNDHGAPASEVAAHLHRCAPGRQPWGADVLRTAARAAMASASPADAARHLERAVAERGRDDVRAELWAELGAAQAAVGSPHAIATLETALDLAPDAHARMEMTRLVAQARCMSGDLEAGTLTFRNALENGASGAGDDPASARLLAGYISFAVPVGRLAPDADRYLARYRSAPGATLAERVGLVGASLVDAMFGRSASGSLDGARRALGGGALAEAGADLGLVVEQAAFILAVGDELDEAESILDDAIAAGRATGSAVAYATARHFRSLPRLLRGDLAGAAADTRVVLEMEPRAMLRILEVAARASLARAEADLGDVEAARATLAGAPMGPQLEGTFDHCYLEDAAARVELAAGNAAGALEHALACGRTGPLVGAENPALTRWRSTAARALLALGDRAEAARHARDELAAARRVGTPRSIGVALATLAATSDAGDRPDLLAEAVAELRRSPGRLDLAEVLFEHGAALRRAGAPRDSREPLRESLDLARRCGAVALARRARDEVMAAGGRPRRDSLSGVGALTPRERVVAERAATGLTNRQIAEELFVTPRTVSTHLSHAYEKLGISSREELGAVLNRS